MEEILAWAAEKFGKSKVINVNWEKELKNSRYEKDKVFSNLFLELKKSGTKLETETIINTLFTQEIIGTQYGEMLHTIDGPFQLQSWT